MEPCRRSRRVNPLSGRYRQRRRPFGRARRWHIGSVARYRGRLQPLLGRAESGRRFHLGRVRTLPGLSGARRSRHEPARELPCRSVPRARARIRSARRRRRYQRRGLDGARGKQPSRQLRSAQMQRHRRPHDRRQRMPRRLDAVSDERPEAERHRHPRRLPLFQLGRSVRHPRTRREQAVGNGIEFGFTARARSADARVDHDARALSARVLFARHGRPHR